MLRMMARHVSTLVLAIVLPLVVWALPDLSDLKGTKVFDMTVTWQKYAPDGVSRDMLLVNGKSPGLTIEVEQDDWVVVNVFNKSPFNTSVHFHGMCSPLSYDWLQLY